MSCNIITGTIKAVINERNKIINCTKLKQCCHRSDCIMLRGRCNRQKQRQIDIVFVINGAYRRGSITIVESIKI